MAGLFLSCTANKEKEDEVSIQQEDSHTYYTSWASSQYQAEPNNQPVLALEGTSLRQIVHASVGGEHIRVKFSNLCGTSNLKINEAHIALTDNLSKIKKESDTLITFSGKSSCVIAAGSEFYSDYLEFSFDDLDCLTVTIFFDYVPEEITGHMGARTNSYFMKGNHCSDEVFDTSYKCDRWYVLAAIEVEKSEEVRVLSCFGDSITDGRGSTTDKQNRWTDILSQRLLTDPSYKNIAVINQGIGGTCLTTNGLTRYNRDVLSAKGSYYVIVLYGINDIIYLNSSAERVIEGYKSLIKKAHKNNLVIYGGTILPFGNCNDYSEEKNKVRLAVNEWILNTGVEDGGFDASIDFASVMEDASSPELMKAEYDCSDGLHPNEKGYYAMGNAVDLDLFSKNYEDLKKDWPDTSSARIQNRLDFKFVLQSSIPSGSKVQVYVKGKNMGSKGFRIWLVDNNTTTLSEQYKFEGSGPFEINTELTSTGTVNFLYFKGITYDTAIEDLILEECYVIINDEKTEFNVIDDLI